MKRHLVISAVLALSACASNDTAYRHGDGDYRGPYNDGYYAAAENGYGDYYYDSPQFAYDDYYGCGAFDYGYGAPGWGFGASFGYAPGYFGPCGYNAWYGFGYYGDPWGWYRPRPHHHHHDNDHDADDPPDGGLGSLTINTFGTSRSHAAMHAGLPWNPFAMRFVRSPRTFDADHFGRDAPRFGRGEPAEHRSHPRDASHR